MKDLKKPFQSLRGFRDLEDSKFLFLVKKLQDLATSFGCKFIEVPILEEYEMFARSVGEVTDIVEKEMFVFDLEDKKVCLRPEITTGIVRAVQNKGISRSRFVSVGPCFRRERPQKGRYRQFFQFDVEMFGTKSVFEDIDCLMLFAEIMKATNVKYKFLLNSIGTSFERKTYSSVLKEYLTGCFQELSETSQERYRKNKILRILDSKEDQEILAKAPQIKQFLSPESKVKIEKIFQFCDQENINYEYTPFLVRGLDYYNDLVFEAISEDFSGSQNSIGGGGRFDGLLELMGGNPTPAVGFAIGLDRLLEVCQLDSFESRTIGVVCLQSSIPSNLLNQLREKYAVVLCEDSLTDALRFANKEKYFGLIIVEEGNKINFRNMATGEQKICSLEEILSF